MNALTLSGQRSLGRIYALEARYELLKLVRMPAYLVPMLAFPLVFYLLFGVAMAERTARGVDIARYLLATYGSFGVMGVALFGFGVGVAIERGQGWMLFKRATPMPPLAYFFAKLAVALICSIVLVSLLFTLGATAGGVRLPAATWLSLAGVLVAGAIPFGAFGLALGYWAGPNSAPATVNLIYLPVALASGMWFPINMLPDFLQRLAPWLPSYHYAQLALGRIGFGRGEPAGRSLAVLVVFAAVSLLLARIGYRRDEGKTFG
jgi:ABC-2 type transport system permease protein